MISRRTRAESFADALAGHRVDDAEIRELVGHAEALCAAAAVTAPSTAFAADLRERLMAEAATTLVPVEAPAARSTVEAPVFRRRLARAATAMIVAVGGVGLVASSAQAVPGDMLYSIKRGVENIEYALHRSDVSKGEYQLSQARERLAEASHLIQGGADDAAIAGSLSDVRSTAESGAERLFDHYADEADPASIEAVSSFLTDASAQLAALSADRPVNDGDALSLTAETFAALAAQAEALCGACAEIEVAELVAAAPSPAPRPSTAAPSAAAPAPVEPVAPDTTTQAAPPAQPVAPSPTPAGLLPTVAPSAAPGIPIVTPLLGALLGDETQEGLVPGLLNGLLGK